jgi:hypothetical protein
MDQVDCTNERGRMSGSGNKAVNTLLTCKELLVRVLLRLSEPPADVDAILPESLMRALLADEKANRVSAELFL